MPYTILIVEDHEDARAYMVIMLRLYGFQVFEAADGNEALNAVELYHPDLIFMDISMPVMDGLEATRIIRAAGDINSRIPIIALTAFDNSYKMKALDAGCTELIQKPVDFDKLAAIIRKYLP